MTTGVTYGKEIGTLEIGNVTLNVVERVHGDGYKIERDVVRKFLQEIFSRHNQAFKDQAHLEIEVIGYHKFMILKINYAQTLTFSKYADLGRWSLYWIQAFTDIDGNACFNVEWKYYFY